jgi:hypothetical protein
MTITFKTTIFVDGNNTAVNVPSEQVELLAAGKRAPVVVTIGKYSYRSTLAVMGGVSLIPLSKAHRDAAGVNGGDTVVVTLTLDEQPRIVEVPEKLETALKKVNLWEIFEALSYSQRKEFARQIDDAKADETRERRIKKILEQL